MKLQVKFSIKPGDQTNETERPNLVKKQDYQKGEYQSFSFLLSNFSLTKTNWD